MIPSMRATPTCIFALIVACLAFAQATRAEVAAPTYSPDSIVRLILRDANPDPDGGWTGRNLTRHRSLDATPALDMTTDRYRITDIDVREIQVQWRRRWLVLARLDPSDIGAVGVALVGLVDPGPAPRLLDLADKSTDQFSGFDDPPAWRLAAGTSVAILNSNHANSNQTYEQIEVLFARNDRIQRLTNVFALSEAFCGFKREETPAFAAIPRAGADYADVRVTLTETVTHFDEGCGGDQRPAAGARSWSDVFRWTPARGAFVPLTHHLDEIDKVNQGRL